MHCQQFYFSGAYTVTAADNSTQDYVVTVSVSPNTAKALTSFSFVTPAVVGTINETAKTIAVTVPYGTNVTALVAAFMSSGAFVKVGSSVQVSGTTANNFTSPVTYTVTAADNSTQDYVVTVTVSPNTAKALTSFSFATPAVLGTINESAKTVAVTVPYGTNVTALSRDICISRIVCQDWFCGTGEWHNSEQFHISSYLHCHSRR